MCGHRHAAGREQAAVEVDHVPAPSPLVEIVDVLRDDGTAGNSRLDTGDGHVSRVGLRGPYPSTRRPTTGCPIAVAT